MTASVRSPRSAGVRNFDAARELVNRSRYGLGATTYTRDLDEPMRAVNELQSGRVWVNAPVTGICSAHGRVTGVRMASGDLLVFSNPLFDAAHAEYDFALELQ
jgi:hypothetical protein